MGIFDFLKKKTDVEEYYEKREKEKKKENLLMNNEFSGYTEIKDSNAGEFFQKAGTFATEEVNKILRGNLNKIEKIKQIREITNLSLKEAKDLVDKSEKDIFPDGENFAGKADMVTDLSLKELLHSNISKIEKIKRVRELTGLSLKDAKDLVEKF